MRYKVVQNWKTVEKDLKMGGKKNEPTTEVGPLFRERKVCFVDRLRILVEKHL